MTQNALGPKGRFYQAKRLKETPLCVVLINKPKLIQPEGATLAAGKIVAKST